MPVRKISNYLVNPRYQLKYIFWLSLAGLLLVAANGYLVYHYVHENYLALVDLSPMTEEVKQVLRQELHEIVIRLALISVGFLGIVGGIGLVFSHQTAGPLFHFKRVIGEVIAGNLNARVRLRPKDDFQDVALAFNEMVDHLAKSSEVK